MKVYISEKIWTHGGSLSLHRGFIHVFDHHFQTNHLIKTKFLVDPSWEGGTKVYINALGRMTKMAATPVYDKE